jgi:glycerol-3-phosphate dehydrogenase
MRCIKANQMLLPVEPETAGGWLYEMGLSYKCYRASLQKKCNAELAHRK